MDTCNIELLLQTLFFFPVALSLKAWIWESLDFFFSKTWTKPPLSSWTLLIFESILLRGLSQKLFYKMLFCHTHGAERWRWRENVFSSALLCKSVLGRLVGSRDITMMSLGWICGLDHLLTETRICCFMEKCKTPKYGRVKGPAWFCFREAQLSDRPLWWLQGCGCWHPGQGDNPRHQAGEPVGT